MHLFQFLYHNYFVLLVRCFEDVHYRDFSAVYQAAEINTVENQWFLIYIRLNNQTKHNVVELETWIWYRTLGAVRWSDFASISVSIERFRDLEYKMVWNNK